MAKKHKSPRTMPVARGYPPKVAMWDAIVVGIGGLGAVVAGDLAKAGCKTLGIDRFAPGHKRGSSHGATRIIRQAYFEHPDYVPLLRLAYKRWAGLEHKFEEKLFHRSGVLEIGPEDGMVVPGVLRAAREHNLRVDALTGKEISERFPAIAPLPKDRVGVFEQDAGYLKVERSVCLWAKRAQAEGAELRSGLAVLGWNPFPGGYEVTCDQGTFQAKRLVLCPGAWAPRLLPKALATRLRVLRKVLLWYRSDTALLEQSGFPCWLFEEPDGIFYGFPAIDSLGLKAAEHSGGSSVQNPLELDRDLYATDHKPVEDLLQRRITGVEVERPLHYEHCMYTMSPDEHFVVGPAPDTPNLWLGAGLSGHGFKLVPALGRSIVDGLLGIDNPQLSLFSPNRLLNDEAKD